MAKIDDLISQVKDESLRVDLAAAATELRRRKKFGLVFESHIPETVALAAQVGLRRGVQVRLRKEPTDQTNYTVDALKGARATISAGDQSESVKVSDLLVVKPFGEPIYPVLRQSDPPIVRSEDRPFHTIINGENYFALELLQFAYRGQVDVVYADPPFNGMQSTWAYNNKIVDSNDVWKNSLWASMMEKRLQLCKSLLKPDTGIAVIAIDEHEVAHLSMLLEDIFPSPTYLRQMVTAVINPKGTGKANLARVDEYLFFVIPNTGKSLVSIPEAPPPWHAGKQEEEGQTDELLDELSEDAEEEAEETDQHDESDDEPDAEEEGYPFPIEELPLWERRHARRRGGESSYRSQRPNQFYPLWIDVKDGVVVRAGSSPTVLSARPSFRKQGGLKPIWPIDSEGNERCWRFIPESMQLLIDAGRVILGRYNETQDTYTINYWVKSNTKKRPKTVWWEKRHDAGTHGTSLLHKLLGDRQVFNFPKSLYSVADSLNVILSDRKDALVVDPFGGSGTTIHALALMNAADEGRRRGILITNNEVDQKSAKELNEQGYFTGDKAFEARGVYRRAAVPRIKAAFTGRQAKSGKPLVGKYLGGKPMSEGFAENVAFLDLNYENPDAIESGECFEAVLPLLWMSSGAIGDPQSLKPEASWLIDDSRPFAVLLDEDHFRDFARLVRSRADITHVWLVTDSESAFARMRARLPTAIQVGMLYRDYLRNFVANARRAAK